MGGWRLVFLLIVVLVICEAKNRGGYRRRGGGHRHGGSHRRTGGSGGSGLRHQNGLGPDAHLDGSMAKTGGLEFYDSGRLNQPGARSRQGQQEVVEHGAAGTGKLKRRRHRHRRTSTSTAPPTLDPKLL